MRSQIAKSCWLLPLPVDDLQDGQLRLEDVNALFVVLSSSCLSLPPYNYAFMERFSCPVFFFILGILFHVLVFLLPPLPLPSRCSRPEGPSLKFMHRSIFVVCLCVVSVRIIDSEMFILFSLKRTKWKFVKTCKKGEKRRILIFPFHSRIFILFVL